MAQSLYSLLRTVGIEVPVGLLNPSIEGFSCDSRKVKKGDLFFGLPGGTVDGGTFCLEAFSSGAVAAVVGSSVRNCIPKGKENVVVVAPDSVSELMGVMSAVFCNHPSSKLRLIGVTGTNGKTTTTHLIEYLSQAMGETTALFGTLVNRWPMHSEVSTHTTLSGDKLNFQLAKAVASGVSIAAMEVSSHSLAQHRVAGLSFSGAIFTNLTQDHLDYHDSMESYFEAKAMLFKPPLLQVDKANTVVNIDDPWGAHLAKQLKGTCWRTSLDPVNIKTMDPELFITDIKMTSKGVEGSLKSPCGERKFSSPLIGRFNLMNLLEAVGALLQQGFELDALLSSIPDFPGVPGRMDQVKVLGLNPRNDLPTVIVDYAHTPDGLRNALNAIEPFTSGKLICVFGCGGDRDKSKRSKMGEIAAKIADRVIVTSDNPRTEDPSVIINDILSGMPTTTEIIVESDRALAIKYSILNASSGDVVLIAGKGHEDYQVIGQEKIDFDDRLSAEKAMRLKSIS